MVRKAIKILFILSIVLAIKASAQNAVPIRLADPTIFYHHKTYYLYGTGETKGRGGFEVFSSPDLKNWKDEGLALKMGDAFGNKGFWAPQVFVYKNKFYMAYVADENIAIAESDSPLGPFTQKVKKSIAAPTKMIDPFVFFDGDKIYLYHVRLINGNRLYVAELNSDFTTINEETAKECLHAAEPWENTQHTGWGVTEGPTVVKRKGLYYLFYSANDYRNVDYAVGYATGKTPYGPWKRYTNNPVLSRIQTQMNGTGHGDFFTDKKGKLNYVFHTHESNTKVGQRKTAVIAAKFAKGNGVEETLKIDSTTFRYLNK
ncbi:glycoside hydrolase family 43 protein [Pedobacter endophyticus]|uniref:Glycoside hydrolase family 43 protein n=1 Tax=Pedobacter endophyticus TaxID=2789740 RepID=A0A7S9KYS1_9SPHI|nr:glycoside hydrolase family 43 protein [Pedobacter endophyticus]QPH39345.1 glycoside hydrolase family 43 protein [Pedobacter endophyticus]